MYVHVCAHSILSTNKQVQEVWAHPILSTSTDRDRDQTCAVQRCLALFAIVELRTLLYKKVL